MTTRLLKGFRQLPHKKRLRRLGQHSLNMRHLRGDFKAANNVFIGGLDLDLSLIFIPSVRQALRGHPFKVLQGPRRRLRRKRPSQYEASNSGRGSPPLLLPPLLSTHSNAKSNLSRRILLQKARYFPPSYTPPQLLKPLFTVSRFMLSTPIILCYTLSV